MPKIIGKLKIVLLDNRKYYSKKIPFKHRGTTMLRCFALGMATLRCMGMFAQSQALTNGMNALFRTADEHNTSINSYRTALQKADADVLSAKAQRLPDVNASLSFSYIGDGQLWSRKFGEYTKADMPHFGNNFSLEAQQVVYSGGALSGGIRMAEKGREMTLIDGEENRRGVHLLLAGLFLQRHSLANQLDVVDRNIALVDTLIMRTRNRHDAGVVLKNDITRYELMREQMILRKTVLDDQMNIVEKQMKTALNNGDDIGSILPAEAFEISSLQCEDYWQTLATAENSSLKKAYTAADMSRIQQKITRSALMPKIALVAENHLNGPILIEVPPIDKNFNYWFVGIGVKYDISSLYKGKKKVRSADVAAKFAEEQTQVAKEGIGDAVHAAYVALLTVQAELRTREKSMELARQNYDVIANRYNEGLALVTDMTDAANVRLDAELQYENARISVVSALYRLKYIAGDI
ncbi:MAG: TolC family protein [Bacteroidaceae bacterium]|nr:TolC family protein [Bacteroidaceae bacterium]